MTTQIEHLMDEYVKAWVKVNRISDRLEELWEEEDYKRRNKVIWGEWSKATQKANKAESRLLSALQSHSRDLS